MDKASLCTAPDRKMLCFINILSHTFNPASFLYKIFDVAWKYVELRDGYARGIYNINPSNFTSNFEFFGIALHKRIR